MRRLSAAAGRIAGCSLGTVALVVVVLVGLVRQPSCGASSFPPGPRAEPERLAAHVSFLTTSACPRSPRYPAGIERAAAYIAAALAHAGAAVREQPYLAGGIECRNLIGALGPGAGGVVVVGAHYDAFGDLPGADDNASGVAALLELARLLGARRLPGAVELVAYSTEEPPHFGGSEMGSAVHARSLAASGREVVAMVSLEMVGYFTAEQPRQAALLDLAYPRHGHFACVAGRWADRALARAVKRAFRGGTSVDVVSWSGPTALGADLSDHRCYWAEGYPAVMVTDTSYLRNPNYHAVTDTADTLDYARMAGVVDGVLVAVTYLSSTAVAGSRAR